MNDEIFQGLDDPLIEAGRKLGRLFAAHERADAVDTKAERALNDFCGCCAAEQLALVAAKQEAGREVDRLFRALNLQLDVMSAMRPKSDAGAAVLLAVGSYFTANMDANESESGGADYRGSERCLYGVRAWLLEKVGADPGEALGIDSLMPADWDPLRDLTEDDEAEAA